MASILTKVQLLYYGGCPCDKLRWRNGCVDGGFWVWIGSVERVLDQLPKLEGHMERLESLEYGNRP